MSADKIHAWFRKSIASNKASHKSAYDVMVDCITTSVGMIEGLIAPSSRIIATTARQSVNEESDYLRPLSSWPDAARVHFEKEHTQKPFSIPDLGAFLSGGLRNAVSDIGTDKSFYLLEEFSCQDAISAPPANGVRIQPRIKDFIAHMEGTNLERLLADPAAHCITVLDLESASRRGRGFRVRSMLAVYYFRSDKDAALDYKRIQKEASRFFENVRLLRDLDGTLFRSKSAELINNMVSLFTNGAVAKADKVAFALEQIRHLAATHLIGRNFSAHPRVKAVPDDPKKAISVHFIQTRFERAKDSHDVEPKLELYPLAMARENPLGALIVANPELPMLSKLLLRHYMKGRNRLFISRDEAERAIKTHAASKRWPKNHAVIDENFCSAIELQSRDASMFRADDELAVPSSHRLWNSCYRNIEQDRQPRHFLTAFVVEGETIDPDCKAKLLPHGILFFEGWFIDSFSKSDLATLRILAVGFSSLLRLTSHAMSPLSYDKAIWETYKTDVNTVRGASQPEHAEILFHLLRLDVGLLEHLQRKIEPIVADPKLMEELLPAERASIGIAASFIKRFGPALMGTSDARVNLKYAGHLLRRRRDFYLNSANSIEKFRKDMDGKYKQPGAFLTFLRSCPSNFVWSPYLGTIGEVLADRISTRELTMARINVGFSADAVILAAVHGEFSQIVKLASKRKLKAEKDAYQRFVRYRIPYAARQPLRGLALDSAGNLGMWDGRLPDVLTQPGYRGPRPDEKTQNDSFGALVSDVVDGGRPRESDNGQRNGINERSRIATLESIIAEELSKVGKQESQGTPPGRIGHVLDAIKDHFQVGVKLWSVPEGPERDDWENENIDGQPLGRTTVAHLIEYRLRLRKEDPEGDAEVEGGAEPEAEAERDYDAESDEGEDNSPAPLGLSPQIIETLYSLKERGLGPLFALVSQSGLSPDELMMSLKHRADQLAADPDTTLLYLTDGLKDAAAADIVRPEVIHGDLNPRNLAWAETFSRFFMIDFERTGYGIAGIDHWKLISSLLVDVFAIAHRRNTHGGKGRSDVAKAIGDRIDAVLTVFDAFTDLMEGPDLDTNQQQVRTTLQAFQDGNHGAGAKFLADAVAAIVLTLFSPSSPPGGDPIDELLAVMGDVESIEGGREGRQKRFTVNLYIASCAALREFQYSIEDLADIPAESIAGLVETLEKVEAKTIGDFAMAAMDYMNNNGPEVHRQPVRIMIRAIIAFRLFMAALPRTERASAAQ